MCGVALRRGDGVWLDEVSFRATAGSGNISSGCTLAGMLTDKHASTLFNHAGKIGHF